MDDESDTDVVSSKKKGGRPRIFSDYKKDKVFTAIRKGRNNNDPDCYRILQAHIDNDSSISEVENDIFKSKEHVKRIKKIALRRKGEEVKEEAEEKETQEEKEMNPDDELPENEDVIKQKVQNAVSEVDDILDEVKKKKLQLTTEEHYAILKEYGVMNLLNDYLRQYLYYKVDEELISDDELRNLSINQIRDIGYEYGVAYDDLKQKIENIDFPLDEDINNMKHVIAKIKKLERELKKRYKRVKSDRSYIREKDKMIYTKWDRDVAIGIHNQDIEHTEIDVNVQNLEKNKKDTKITEDDFDLSDEAIEEELKKYREHWADYNKKVEEWKKEIERIKKKHKS